MFELPLEVPLQLIDNTIRQFNAGQILVALFVVAILGTLPLKSMKAVAINIILFGTILVVTPTSLTGDQIIYRLLGVALLVVGPMLFVAARR